MTKVAEVFFSGFPNDPRPRREIEALRDAGFSIDVFCLKRENQTSRETINGIDIWRFNIERKRTGKIRYIWQYFYFLILAFFLITFKHIRRHYDVVHVHNMPDVLVFSAIILKLTGARIVLDLHDPMPEMFIAKYSLSENHRLIKTLKFFEKKSISFSNLVITPNQSFKELFISRGCPENKIKIVMNSPQEKIFENHNNNSSRSSDNKFVMMYHGGVFERHGLDTAVEAISLVRDKIPNLEFRVFGPGEYADKFLDLVSEHNLNEIITYYGKVKLERIAKEIQSIDLGIIPNKLNPFTNLNFPTRIFEYLCLQKPVIVPDTKGINDYFDEDSIFFFEAGNAINLADVIFKVYSNSENTKKIISRGYKVYLGKKWDSESKNLIESINGLLHSDSLPSQSLNTAEK